MYYSAHFCHDPLLMCLCCDSCTSKWFHVPLMWFPLLPMHICSSMHSYILAYPPVSTYIGLSLKSVAHCISPIFVYPYVRVNTHSFCVSSFSLVAFSFCSSFFEGVVLTLCCQIRHLLPLKAEQQISFFLVKADFHVPSDSDLLPEKSTF